MSEPKTKYDWQPEDFHPMHQCFFCKKRKAVTVASEELYKVIRNTEGFPGYVVNYTEARISIPICSECSAAHRRQGNLGCVLMVIAWIVTAGIIYYYWLYDPAEWLFTLFASAVIAVPLSSVPLWAMLITWTLLFPGKVDEMASHGDYPVVKKLLSMGWQSKLPSAKYGERKNEEIDKESVDRLNAEYQLQARQVIADFLRWCQQEK